MKEYRYLNIIIPKFVDFVDTLEKVNEHFELLLETGKLDSIINTKSRLKTLKFLHEYLEEYNNSEDYLIALNLKSNSVVKEDFVKFSLQIYIDRVGDNELWMELDDFLNNFDAYMNSLKLGLL